jgi:hypothetical protein
VADLYVPLAHITFDELLPRERDADLAGHAGAWVAAFWRDKGEALDGFFWDALFAALLLLIGA